MEQEQQPKPSRFLTILITAVVTFLLTTVWYLTLGRVSLSPLESGKTAAGSKYEAIKSEIQTSYIEDVDDAQLTEGSIRGMVAALGDPYSYYYTPEEAETLLLSIEGSYEGIGVTIYVSEEDGLLTVLAPYEDTPADRAGIVPGDKILQVDDMVVTAENYQAAVDYMKGATEESRGHEEMTITIMRGQEIFDLQVTREPIILKTVSSDQYGDVAYIRLSGFDEHTTEQFCAALEGFDRSTVRGLVLDLRDNPGGIMETAVDIADLFLDEGLVVYTQTKTGAVHSYESKDGADDIPVTVLVNENSASASEILSGALKDRGRAKLVGNKTFGKGVAQTIQFFQSDNSALKLTTQKYYLPSGVCIDGTGITPDVAVENPTQEGLYYAYQLPYEEDLQLQKAIELLEDAR